MFMLLLVQTHIEANSAIPPTKTMNWEPHMPRKSRIYATKFKTKRARAFVLTLQRAS